MAPCHAWWFNHETPAFSRSKSAAPSLLQLVAWPEAVQGMEPLTCFARRLELVATRPERSQVPLDAQYPRLFHVGKSKVHKGPKHHVHALPKQTLPRPRKRKKIFQSACLQCNGLAPGSELVWKIFHSVYCFFSGLVSFVLWYIISRFFLMPYEEGSNHKLKYVDQDWSWNRKGS